MIDDIWQVGSIRAGNFPLFGNGSERLFTKSKWILKSDFHDIWWHIMTSDEGAEPYPGTIIYFADETSTHMVSKVVILSWNSGRSAGIH